jgi:hypothetical protein
MMFGKVIQKQFNPNVKGIEPAGSSAISHSIPSLFPAIFL